MREPDGARRGFLEGSDVVAVRDRSDPVEDRASLRERLLDVPWDVPRPVWYGRLALLAVVAIWATSVLLSRMTEPPTLLHLTVILFHEAGHVIFMPFGEACASPAARSGSC